MKFVGSYKLWFPLAVLMFSLYYTSFCNSAREFPPVPEEGTVDNYTNDRVEMVEKQIEERGVSNKGVLKAMKSVKRHLFVPSSLQRAAYADRPLPIGYGQTISQPYIVAYMTEMIKIDEDSKVLEIGTGSGYQAAVLAEITDKVYSIEIVPELARHATERLKKVGYKHVLVKEGDGYHGWKEHGPFDAIIVTAASETIPPPLLKQLKTGGRMIIPVGSQFQVQMLVLLKKTEEGITVDNLMPVRFVPFRRKKE